MKKLLLLLLTSISVMSADLRLGWTASASGDADGYLVYMATGASGAFAVVGSTTNTTVTVSNLTPGLYRFYVTATNLWGESLPSNTVQTPAGKPGAVTLTIVK